MAVGIGAVYWIVQQTRAGRFSDRWATPVGVVELYWSSVDIVWVVLYPLIYQPALGIVVLIGVMFMRFGQGTAVARGFALAGLSWLLLLLGVGTMDPMTCAVYAVHLDTKPTSQWQRAENRTHNPTRNHSL
jgi:hypothetical protein